VATKKEREIIWSKFNGRCSYCGDTLQKSWHVDELLPCRRKFKDSEPYYKNRKTNITMSIGDAHRLPETSLAGWEYIPSRLVPDGYSHPERLTIENQMPSCASCNISKHSGTLEDFRSLISGFMKHLNEHSTQYKIAKRYGLVKEDVKPIVFYFEAFKSTT
jgi:5-methylcytosine-specific restriction endonuclease McrA